MTPEVYVSKEREVDSDAVEERADNARGAHILGGGTVGKLGARDNMRFVGRAIRLLARMLRRMVTEGLGPVSGILGHHHHSNRIVEGQRDQCEHDCCHQHSLWGGTAFPDPEDVEPEEPYPNGGKAYNGAAEEYEHQEHEDDIVDWEDLR